MSKLNITLAPPEPRDKSTYSKVDILLDSIEPIKTPIMSEPMYCKYPKKPEPTEVVIVDNKCIVCNLEYFGHDHNTDYVKCTVCGHIEEE